MENVVEIRKRTRAFVVAQDDRPIRTSGRRTCFAKRYEENGWLEMRSRESPWEKPGRVEI